MRRRLFRETIFGFGLTAIALTAMPGAAMAVDYKYGWMTGALPGTEIVAAYVVREPAFIAEKDEQVQAMDQAKTAIEEDYCAKKGQEFVADPGLIIFDKGTGEWMVGGVCR